MKKPTVLEREVLNPLLNTARKSLERDFFIIPFLLVQAKAPNPHLVPLDVLQKGEQRKNHLMQVGDAFRQHGQPIQAAVMLTEIRIVHGHDVRTAQALSADQIRDNQYAIHLIGRDADYTRLTHVVQPFVWLESKRAVWGECLHAVYNEPVQTAGQPTGLLDYLFLAQEVNDYVSHQ